MIGLPVLSSPTRVFPEGTTWWMLPDQDRSYRAPVKVTLHSPSKTPSIDSTPPCQRSGPPIVRLVRRTLRDPNTLFASHSRSPCRGYELPCLATPSRFRRSWRRQPLGEDASHQSLQLTCCQRTPGGSSTLKLGACALLLRATFSPFVHVPPQTLTKNRPRRRQIAVAGISDLE